MSALTLATTRVAAVVDAGGSSALVDFAIEAERGRLEVVACLRGVEWEGRGTLDIPTCPDCGAYDPARLGEYEKYPHATSRAGHRPGCELAALLSTEGVDR